MRFSLYPFENPIILSDEWVSILELEQTSLFQGVLETIYRLTIGEEGSESITLFEKDQKEIDFSRDVLWVTDFFDLKKFDGQINKAFVSKLVERLKEDVEISHYLQMKLQELSTYIAEEVVQYEYDSEFTAVPLMHEVLKLFKFQLKISQEPTIVERLLKLIDCLQEFGLTKLIILVNIRSLLKEDEIQALEKQIVAKKAVVLMIEPNLTHKCNQYEKIYQIDQEYEEYQL